MRTTDHEIDLRWFFTEAAGQCGVRSVQGGFERAMEARALAGKADGAMAVHDSPSYHPDDGPTDAMFAAWTRAREVWARLAQCSPRARWVLELQYGDSRDAGGCSLALLASLPAAAAAHRRATTAARVALARSEAAGRVRARTTAAGAPTRQRRAIAGMTPTTWVLWLVAHEPEVVRGYVREGLALVDGAVGEYGRAAAA